MFGKHPPPASAPAREGVGCNQFRLVPTQVQLSYNNTNDSVHIMCRKVQTEDRAYERPSPNSVVSYEHINPSIVLSAKWDITSIDLIEKIINKLSCT